MSFQMVEIPVEDSEIIHGEKVKVALEKYDLEAKVCGVFGLGCDFIHEDPAVHQQCFDYLDDLMDFCTL